MLTEPKEALGSAELLAGTFDVVDAHPVRAFADETIALLAEVSSILMADPAARALPDVVTFAFWCRRANVERIAADYPDAARRVGRGLALHIAPSNVPVNFAFSWAFSQMAGNVDIVRVPSKPFEQIEVICCAIDEAQRALGAARSAFVRYPSDTDITQALSAAADARIVWGGDKTVTSVRSMPCKPRCVDVAFPDRYSIALADASAVAGMDDVQLNRIVHSFYNDVFVMDQNACSSPRVMYWLNPDREQQERFAACLRNEAHRSYALQGAVAVDKYVRLCEDAATGRVVVPVVYDGYLTAVPLNMMPTDPSTLSCYGGYLYEVCAHSLADVVKSLDVRCQTAVCIGVDPEVVRREVVSSGRSCIDRVVEAGHAMDMTPVWDGFDLPRVLSRLIEVS